MVAFSLVEDGADRCLGGIDHKRQLRIGTGESQRCRLGKTGLQSFKGSQLFGRHLDGAVSSASQRREGRCDFRTVRDEAAIDVDHTKESFELASGVWLWKVRYSFDFGLEGPDTLGINRVPKKTYFGPPKAAFVCVHHQTVFI